MIDYTLSAALFALLSTLLLLCLTGHGYANTVDRIALFLHRHATRVRNMHRERDRVMSHMWQERPGKDERAARAIIQAYGEAANEFRQTLTVRKKSTHVNH